MRNGKKDKSEDRIVENISPENSPNKDEPSVAERYVKDKNNTLGAKFEDSDPTAALNLEEDDRGTSDGGTSDVRGVRGMPAVGLSTGSATKTASTEENNDFIEEHD
ncbi:MAG TPA: hypothetical protein VE573_16670 [Nitrososphaeraceae archaeon]|nr:hypothetical protein [Nitrososphaeraceae archaeon]